MCEAVTRLAFGTVFNFPLSFRKIEQFNLNFFNKKNDTENLD